MAIQEIIGGLLVALVVCSLSAFMCCYPTGRRRDGSGGIPGYDEYFPVATPLEEFPPPPDLDPALMPPGLVFTSTEYVSVTGNVTSVYEYNE
jgi:hypothetical protein